MRAKMLVYLLIFVNLITFAENQSFYISPVRLTNNCRENEVFNNCGSACDSTCENITTTSPFTREKPLNNYEPYVVLDEPCKPQYNCIPGCYCRKPLYRNRFGECVEEEQCKRNLNRNDFVEELNKFLNINSNENLRNKNERRPIQQTNQKYISVNDDSESIINPRTGYYPKKTTGYQSATSQNYQNILNLEKDFFHNLFDDIFSRSNSHNDDSPRQQTNYRTNYNYNNYNTANNNGNINVKDVSSSADDKSLEKQIEKEADIIIQQIHSGLKIKKFIVETLKSLVNRSQYSSLGSASSIDNQKDTKKGLITTKK